MPAAGAQSLVYSIARRPPFIFLSEYCREMRVNREFRTTIKSATLTRRFNTVSRSRIHISPTPARQQRPRLAPWRPITRAKHMYHTDAGCTIDLTSRSLLFYSAYWFCLSEHTKTAFSFLCSARKITPCLHYFQNHKKWEIVSTFIKYIYN